MANVSTTSSLSSASPSASFQQPLPPSYGSVQVTVSHTSGSNSSDNANNSSHFDVIVIGAGLSGLMTAHALRNHKLKVAVVEAAPSVGGRVKTEDSFSCGQPIELGAELLHGDRTSLMRLIRSQGWPVEEIFTWAHGDGGPRPSHPVQGAIGMYYFPEKKKMIRANDPDIEFQHLNQVLRAVEAVDVTATPDIPFLQFLQKAKVSEQMIRLAEAGYANTLCSTLRDLPLHSTVAVERSWGRDGSRDFRFRGGLKKIVDFLSEGLPVFTDWPVKKVVWASELRTPQDDGRQPQLPQQAFPSTVYPSATSNPTSNSQVTAVPAGGLLSVWGRDASAVEPGCSVISTRGEVLKAHKVVVAVPITILQDGDITFVPPLPKEKIQAAKRIVMEPAFKMSLRFSKPFWPQEMQGVICADSLVPEFWTSNRDSPAPNEDSLGATEDKLHPTLQQQPSFFLTGFATSNYARRLSNMLPQERQKQVLEQLDEMYGTEENPNPASSSFLGMVVQDWSKARYIRGGYSAPSKESKCPGSDRRMIAEPVAKRLYFAGEYTEDNFSSMNAALDSGQKAAHLILTSLGRPVAIPAKL